MCGQWLAVATPEPSVESIPITVSPGFGSEIFEPTPFTVAVKFVAIARGEVDPVNIFVSPVRILQRVDGGCRHAHKHVIGSFT